MTLRLTLPSLLFVALLLSSPKAEAQDLRSLDQLISRADMIAEVQITTLEPRWERGMIVSRVTARIEECLFGQCDRREISFDVLGGERDGVTQVVSGSSLPSVGETFLVMMETQPPSPERIRAPLSMIRITAPGAGFVTIEGNGEFDLTFEEIRAYALTVHR